PSTSSCSIHDWESGGVVMFRCSVPMALVLVVPDGGGVPAFFCTSEGFTLTPAAGVVGSWATATVTLTSNAVARGAHLRMPFFIVFAPSFLFSRELAAGRKSRPVPRPCTFALHALQGRLFVANPEDRPWRRIWPPRRGLSRGGANTKRICGGGM